jgi:hypothetical protein
MPVCWLQVNLSPRKILPESVFQNKPERPAKLHYPDDSSENIP